jgi:pantoate--beta-alanine ligase
MDIIRTVEEMQQWSEARRLDGKKVSFVPTMGALHEGHLSLLKMARKLGDGLVLSIYVNPTQFGPKEDVEKYPRDLEGDLFKVKNIPVDCVFFPSNKVMYPNGYATFVEVEKLSDCLCGSSRKGHFRGVTTVVLKLFNAVKPHVAVFGEKDFQQLTIIRRMVRDLNLSVEIKSHPIVREGDGLAMSSRNAYLNPDERKAALSIFRSLKVAEDLIKDGETSCEKILAEVRKTIESSKIPKVDYAKFVDAETLAELPRFKAPALLAVAAFVGKARLIDNACFY